MLDVAIWETSFKVRKTSTSRRNQKKKSTSNQKDEKKKTIHRQRCSLKHPKLLLW